MFKEQLPKPIYVCSLRTWPVTLKVKSKVVGRTFQFVHPSPQIKIWDKKQALSTWFCLPWPMSLLQDKNYPVFPLKEQSPRSYMTIPKHWCLIVPYFLTFNWPFLIIFRVCNINNLQLTISQIEGKWNIITVTDVVTEYNNNNNNNTNTVKWMAPWHYTFHRLV